MNRLHKYQLILAVAGIAVAVFLVGQLFFLRPLANEVRDLRRQTQEKTGTLRSTGWPLEPESLETLAITKHSELATAQRRKNEVLSAAMSLFQAKIQSMYGNAVHFQKQVTRLDYQEEFYRIESKLKEQGIVLDRDILGISEDSIRTRIYELVLQLWTLEAVAELITEYELRPLMMKAGAGSSPGAAVAVVQPRRYYLHANDAEPYLLEFPVRLRLRGSVSQLQKFLLAAGAENAFVAVPHAEVYKPVPGKENENPDIVEADIECSAFYVLDGDIRAEAAIKQKERVLPRGA